MKIGKSKLKIDLNEYLTMLKNGKKSKSDAEKLEDCYQQIEQSNKVITKPVNVVKKP